MSDILKTQRSFARKAQAVTDHCFEDLYHLLCRKEWMEAALKHVLSNKGARTPGVDGINKEHLKTEEQRAELLASLHADLKSGTYRPMPVRRIWRDKPGKQEKRGLGVPTIRDRVVQELLRMLMEPIWESDFLECSNGFRPGRSTKDCVSYFYSRVHTVNKYFWAIEGDIRKCFDGINHRILVKLIRRRIADNRIIHLIEAMLKAGVMDGVLFHDTPEGTPQGGILSPLLANIYLHELDMWWWRKFGSLSKGEKWKRRQQGLGNAILVRYADDFVILWNGTRQGAEALRDELKQFLHDKLHLELSDEKTRITHLTDGLDFLGFHIQWRLDGTKPWLRVTPTKANIKRFRAKIKAKTKRGTTYMTPEMRFKSLNRVIRGWGNYYQHVSFSHDASELDWWINERVLIWLKNKHQGKGVRWVLNRYKQREVTKRLNRWNFGVPKESNPEEVIFIAKLSDKFLTKYIRRNKENPYLTAEVIPNPPETETPFLEARVGNVPPEKLKWLDARAEAFERDEYRCATCGTTETLDVHHIVPQREGGTDNLDNLVVLCRKCHSKTSSYGRPPKREE